MTQNDDDAILRPETSVDEIALPRKRPLDQITVGERLVSTIGMDQPQEFSGGPRQLEDGDDTSAEMTLRENIIETHRHSHARLPQFTRIHERFGRLLSSRAPFRETSSRR